MLSLLRQRNFFLLWVGQVISIMGDWVLYIALPFYVYQLTQSTLATGAMFIISTLPRIIMGSVAGVFVDRWDRKRTMIAADILRAVLVLALLPVHSAGQIWIVYTVGLLESLISQFFVPAKNAFLPGIISKSDLAAGNSLNSVGENVARLIAPPIGGAMMAALGLYSIVLADSFSFLFSAGMLALILAPAREPAPEKPAQAAAPAWVSFWREWLEGLKMVRNSPVLRVLFVGFVIAMLGEGIVDVLLIPFIQGTLKGDAVVLGWMMSAQAAGSLLGGSLMGWIGKRFSPIRLIIFGAIGWGVFDLLIFNIRVVPLMLAFFVLVGVPLIALMVSVNIILQSEISDEYRGRVFGSLGATISLSILVGMSVSSIFGNILGVATILNAACILFIIAGLYTWIKFPQGMPDPVPA